MPEYDTNNLESVGAGGGGDGTIRVRRGAYNSEIRQETATVSLEYLQTIFIGVPYEQQSACSTLNLDSEKRESMRQSNPQFAFIYDTMVHQPAGSPLCLHFEKRHSMHQSNPNNHKPLPFHPIPFPTP